MPQIEEGFKISFTGDAGSLEDASQAAAASIGNVLKAAAKVSQLDSFKALSQSASKAVTNINAITGDLQKIRIDYTLPNFAPLQRLILSVKGDMNKAFLSVIPQPDTNPFTRAIAAMVTSAERNLETLRNTRVNMGAVQPPDLTLLKKAVDVARNELSKTALVSFPPPPKVEPIIIPAADTTRFTQSIRTVQTTAERVNTLLHSFESVKVPAIQPPSLTALENVVRDARANIDKTFLTPIPTQPFVNLSKEVQGIITGLKAQKIQVPFAIQQPDLSNIRAGVENAKKTIQDSLNIKIPAPTVQPIPAPKTTGYTTAVQGAIKLINELNSAAGSVATAVKPPDLAGYKAAITAVRNDLQNATLVKVPPVDAKDFNASVTPLQRSIGLIDRSLSQLTHLQITAPAIVPPDLSGLYKAVETAKTQIESVGRFRMPQITVAPVPALDYREFDSSASAISTKIAQINKLFTAVSDTPINAPVLVPFDTKPLQKAVDVSKKLLSETANLALPFIETPDVKPLNTAPYLNSLQTLQQSTLAAQKVITGISAIDVPAPVIQPPSLAPLFGAVATAKKTLSGIELELPKVTVRPIEPIAAPKIDTAPFDTSANALQAKIRDLNGLFKSVDAQDIPAPTLLPLDTHPLLKAVADVKEQIAAVRFAEIKMPTVAPVAVPPLDATVFDRSTQQLRESVQQVSQILQAASDVRIQAPAVLPPNLQPLKAAIAVAKARIESVQQITMPAIVLPQVPALDERNFDSSVVDIRTKIQNINALFGTVSKEPINAPALIPFDVTPLQNAVAAAKREINTAANLKLPTLAVPKIPGLNTTEFEKSVGLLQKRVELANTYLTDYGKTVIPTPVLPTPNLQPLFNAIATAKQNIERSGTIKLPAVDMPSLARVVVPPIESAAFDASVNNVRARLDAVNNAFKGVSLQPIVPPAIQPPDTKPLYNAVEAIKKQIASVRFATIQFPTIERVTVPPVEHGTFDRSIVSVAAQVAQFNALLTQSKATPFVIPTPIPPDETPVRKFVSDIKAQIESLTKLPTATIEGLQLQPLDLRPFDNSVTQLNASIVGIHNALHAISAEPIAPPAIRPPDLSALRDAVEKTRVAIANAADLRLPSIAAITLPPINQTAFNGSFVTLQGKIAAINNLFAEVDNTPIAAPLVAAPNFTDVLTAVAKAKAAINSTFLEPIPLTAFTNASTQILGVFKSLNDQKLNIPFALPDTQTVINQVQAAKANIQKIWGAPVAAPRLNVSLPTVAPLELPPLSAGNYIKAVQDALTELRKDASKGVLINIESTDPNKIVNLSNLIQDLQKQKVSIPFTVQAPDFNHVKQMVDEVRKDLSKASLIKIPAPVIPSIKEPAAPKFFPKIVKGSEQAMQATTNLGRVLQDLPFGFVGIANNLNPLLESFQRLTKESGGVKGALKALGGSLMGAGGIGLALSAFQFFALGGVDALKKMFTTVDKGKSSFDALQERIKAANEATQVFMSTLSDVSFAHLEGAKAAQQELVHVQTLYKATQDQTAAMSLRKQAVDELQKEYPAYFKNISDEAILAGTAKDAYDKLTAAILKSAKARAIQDKLVEIQKEALDVDAQRAAAAQSLFEQAQKVRNAQAAGVQSQREQQKAGLGINAVTYSTLKGVLNTSQAQDGYNSKLQETIGLQQRYAALQARAAKLAGQLEFVPDVHFDPSSVVPKGEFNFFDKFFDFDPNKANLGQKKINDLLEAAKAFKKEFGSGNGLKLAMPEFDTMNPAKAIAAARQYWSDFQKGIVKFVPPVIEVDFNVVPNLKGKFDLLPRFLDTLKQEAEKINNQKIVLRPDITYDAERADILNNFKKTFASIGKKLPKMIQSGGINDKGAKVLIPIGVATNLDQLKQGLKNASYDVQATLDAMELAVSASIRGMMSSVFSGVGEAIGVALAGGDFAEVFKGIFASLGGAIQQLGTEIIALSPLIAAVKKAFQSLQPAAMLAAGVGLVAIGAALKTSFSKVAHMREGGIVPDGFSGDRFPAMLNSREAVIPLDKLDRYINMPQAAGNTTERIRLRGADLELSRARNARRDNRIR